VTSAAIAHFLRHMPIAFLKSYLDYYVPSLAASLNWQNATDPIDWVLNAVDEMDHSSHQDMHDLAERVNNMSHSDGQTALCSVVKNKDEFYKLQNSHERAAWVLINDPVSFRQAEEIRYADMNRCGHMWDSFIGPKGRSLSKDDAAIQEFQEGLRNIFCPNAKMKIELYRRNRPEQDNEPMMIYQVSAYIQGLAESHLELENDEIITKTWRPLHEVAICYEPGAGIIEVIAQGKIQREKIARAFSEAFLRHTITSDQLPLSEYDLSSLMAERSLPTDMEDAVENVNIMSIKLRAINGDGNITLEIPNKHNKSIYQQAYEWFEENSPFLGGFVIQNAKLALQFYPTAEAQRAKILPIKISLPNRCDLNSRTGKKYFVGEKYLGKWGLRKDE